MKPKNNERGYALLTVLLLFVLFSVMGISVLAMNMNASKQFQAKEEQVQARNQAEMGLLHFQSAIKKEVSNYNITQKSSESSETALLRNRKELCALVDNVSAEPLSDSSVHYTVESTIINGCEWTNGKEVEDERIVIIARSTGYSHEVDKSVEGTIELDPPVISDSAGGEPSKPVRPPGVTIVTNPDEVYDESTLRDHIEISGPYKQRKQQVFVESFIINRNPPSRSGENTFEVGGGSGDRITVEKDFYIDGNAFIQNHVCILVRGSLTINGPLNLGTQSEIIVLGNAYIKSASFSGNSCEKNIRVAGNAYQGENKTQTNRYSWNGVVPKNTSCRPPTSWTGPYIPSVVENDFEWTPGDELNPEYID